MKDFKPEVKIGRPDTDLGLLSEHDEKRLDEHGKPVVEGLPWSEAGTGMYLVIAAHTVPIYSDKIMVGRTEIDLGKLGANLKLDIMVSKTGKPTWYQPVIGACLEIPSDLALDKHKRQYVIEWLTNTVLETLDLRRINIRKSQYKDEVFMAVAVAAEKAIAATGL